VAAVAIATSSTTALRVYVQRLRLMRRCHKHLACFLLLSVAFVRVANARDHTLLVGSSVLRMDATTVVKPEYPPSSFSRHHEGPAIVEVHVSQKGSVVAAKVLEAPDAAISDAVDAALKKWSFQPTLLRGTPVQVTGRIVFYFRIVNGKPVVVDASLDTRKRR